MIGELLSSLELAIIEQTTKGKRNDNVAHDKAKADLLQLIEEKVIGADSVHFCKTCVIENNLKAEQRSKLRELLGGDV